mgnify:CR=1 FL=1
MRALQPHLARYLLTATTALLLLSIGVLPFTAPSEPEYVALLLSLTLSASLMIVVIIDVRKQAKTAEVAHRV